MTLFNLGMALFTLAGSIPAFCQDINFAANDGNWQKVNSMLKANPHLVSERDSFTGSTPLHNSANRSVAELLIANGADVNARTIDDDTPLHLAARLLDYYGDYSIMQGKTPLHKFNKDVLELLIARKADVNARNTSGDTPLHTAMEKGYQYLAELLFSQKADVNIKNNKGRTPLHVAASGGFKATVQLLLSNKADVNAKDKSGQTPLHLAALAADTNTEDVRLQPPNAHLEAARLKVQCYHKEIAEMLLAKGANVNAKDNEGKTPMKIAEEKGRKNVAELLRRHGGQE